MSATSLTPPSATTAPAASGSSAQPLAAKLPFEEVLKMLNSLPIHDAMRFLNEWTEQLEARKKRELEPQRKEVSALYDSTMIERLGLDLIASLPVVKPTDLGIKPGLVWVLDEDHPPVDPNKMPHPAVRGVDAAKRPFIAVRYSSNKDSSTKKVEYVFQRYTECDTSAQWGQDLLSCGARLRKSDFERFKNLLEGKSIVGDDRASYFHFPCNTDLTFKMV